MLAIRSPASSTANDHIKEELASSVNTSTKKHLSVSAASSSSSMNRAGSAGAPSLPESPLARINSAATGVLPGSLPTKEHAYGRSRGGGYVAVVPPPLTPLIQVHTVQDTHHMYNTGMWSNDDAAVSNVDFLEGEDSTSSLLALASYSLLGAKFDVELLSSSPGPNRRELVAGEGISAVNSAINVVNSTIKLTFRDGKRERSAIQTTTFTNWVNDRLKVGKHDRKVEDLFTDLKDGIMLLKLLENLTKKKVAGSTGKLPKTEAHKIVNLDLAFKFMQGEAIKMVGVGGMNIYQGDTTLTLGVIWTLIQKYQIRMQGYKVSTKNVMIRWLQALLPRWNITNLTSDWKDGRALIAIINAVKPGIAPNVAKLDPTKVRQNCILAIKIANAYLKIPKIISPDDLSSGAVDELSVMTYLSYFVEPFRAKLLKWVQKTLPQFNLTGFSKDWYNGKAFTTLARMSFPSIVINWGQLDANSDEDYTRMLFETLKKKLGILLPFDAADLTCGRVEEMQIMTMIMLVRSGELVPLSDEVTVRGSGIERANFHKPTSFLIDTSEAGLGQLYIDAFYEEDGQKLKFNLSEKTNQVFNLAYTPVVVSKVIFDITWSEVRIQGSPFTIPVTDSTLVNIVDFESHVTLVEVGVPLNLLLDSRKAGQGHLSAHLQYGSREKVQATVSRLVNGRIRLGYTPTKPGTAVLHLFWNKEELQHLAVTYTVVDIGGYSIQSFPQNKVYCVFEEPEFCVLSGKGLPLNVLQMTAILGDDVQIPIKFKSTNGNKGYASFTPTLPGVYTVEVVCVDQLIKGTPFSIRVSDPHSCKVRGVIPSYLQVHQTHTFEIDSTEAGVGAITFDSSDRDISPLFKSHIMRPDASDLQKLAVTPLVEGDFVVGIKYHGQWISNSPFRLKICDPTKFGVVEQLGTTNVGKPVKFTVKAKERCDNGLSLHIKASGPSAKYSPKITLSDDGLRYSVNFIPWEIGDHEISITYGDFDIPNSPITLQVITFDTDACSAAGSGLQKAYSGVPAHFLILSRQHGLLEDGTLHIKVSRVVDSKECRIRARDNKNGTYSVAYLIQEPGAYLITIAAAGQQIPGSPFKLNAHPGPQAHKCNMYGPALEEDTILTFGKPIDFTVDTSKAGTGKLSVKAVGPEGVPARVFIAKTDHPGRYDINIDTLRHGKHRVSVKWSDNHIPCSPFLIKVFPGADSRKCIAHGPGLEDGLVGKKSAFTIETKNAGAGLLKVRLHGLKGAFKMEIAPINQKNRRTLLANYNPSQPGEYLITIRWSETHIPGSPFRVKIIGDGVQRAPLILYTPTPRLPEVESDFFRGGEIEDEDDESDDTVNSNYLRASASATNNGKRTSSQVSFNTTPVTFRRGESTHRSSKQGAEKMVTFSKLSVPNHARGASPRPMSRKRTTKKGEFEGQVTVRAKNIKKNKLKRK